MGRSLPVKEMFYIPWHSLAGNQDLGIDKEIKKIIPSDIFHLLIQFNFLLTSTHGGFLMKYLILMQEEESLNVYSTSEN